MHHYTCKHCGSRLYRQDGRDGRYHWTDVADGSDTLGSGSECPANERGHEPVEVCALAMCGTTARIVVTVEVIGRPGFRSAKTYCSDAHARDDMTGMDAPS